MVRCVVPTNEHGGAHGERSKHETKKKEASDVIISDWDTSRHIAEQSRAE
jgi:hypothetical protein